MLNIEITFDDGRQQTVTQALPLTLGKDPGCGVRIAHWRVAGAHARVSAVGDFLQIEDLRTFHGTRVNGVRVAQHFPLLPSDEVFIGPARLRFHYRLDPAPAPEPLQTPTKPAFVSVSGGLSPTLRAALHAELFRRLDVRQVDVAALSDEALKVRAQDVLREMLEQDNRGLSADDQAEAIAAVVSDVVGLGVLQPLMEDPKVSEIMVNRHDRIYVEADGSLHLHPVTFANETAVRRVIERVVYPLGRRIDDASPMVDARLSDGSRVNAVIPPIALRGSSLTIRKFPTRRPGLEDLVALGSLDRAMASFLQCCVARRINILIAGGTGSGKTTLLNILGSQVPQGERIVTIEDAAELNIAHPHVVSLEARPRNMEGQGEVTIRDLVRNALRMRPDRIVVGECRGAEALDMLAAMNTGHDGSLTTLHANSPRDALSRLETMVLMAGKDLPLSAIRDQIVRAIQLLVQQSRLPSGKRVITAIDEVTGIESGQIQLQPLVRYERTTGIFQQQGLPPTFFGSWQLQGLALPDWFDDQAA